MTTPFEDRDPAAILTVLDLAPAMVRNFDGRISYWTAGAEHLYGWTAKEAIGRPSHDLLATVFPKPLGEIEAALLSEGCWHGTLEHRTRAGDSIRVASHWALQRDASGRPAAVAEVNTDIGPLQRAEGARLRLAAIVESSNDAIIAKTLDGCITDWNVAAEALFGYRREEIVGKPATLLFPPERVADEAEILNRVHRGERIATFETARRHQDGSIIPVAVTVSPIFDVAGAIIGASTIMRDLRAWVDRDRRLAELQAELAHVGRVSELGQLVAVLVHEINQPLTAISNYLGGVDRMVSLDDFRLLPAAIKGMSEQTARAGAIIRRLGDFARKRPATTQPEDIAKIVEDAVALVSMNPLAEGVQIRTDLAQAAREVMVDRVQIQQVLFNLMRNALQAMADCPRKMLTVTSALKGDDMVEVRVTDTGPGIPDEILDRLFQPFVTTKPEGMGMGLSICRSIIEGHGGQLTVETEAGAGTVFHLTLLRAASG